MQGFQNTLMLISKIVLCLCTKILPTIRIFTNLSIVQLPGSTHPNAREAIFLARSINNAKCNS